MIKKMFILLCLIINVSCVFKNKTQRAYVIEDDKLELINVILYLLVGSTLVYL